MTRAVFLAVFVLCGLVACGHCAFGYVWNQSENEPTYTHERFGRDGRTEDDPEQLEHRVEIVSSWPKEPPEDRAPTTLDQPEQANYARAPSRTTTVNSHRQAPITESHIVARFVDKLQRSLERSTQFTSRADYHACLMPNGSKGCCTPVRLCVLPVFLDSLEVFLKYTCAIDNDHIGVCCPTEFVPNTNIPRRPDGTFVIATVLSPSPPRPTKNTTVRVTPTPGSRPVPPVVRDEPRYPVDSGHGGGNHRHVPPTRDNGGRPSSNPGTKPSGYPSSKPGEYPESKPSDYPASRPSDYPASRPSDYPGTKPSGYPGSRPSDSSGNRPGSGYPSNKPSDSSGNRPGGYPSNTPSNSAGNKPSGSPSNRPSSRPSSKPQDGTNTHRATTSRPAGRPGTDAHSHMKRNPTKPVPPELEELRPTCGIPVLHKRIIGGNEANPNKWAWMAALLRSDTGEHYCGGALISKRYVITAAHCTEGLKAANITVRLGAHNIQEPSENVKDIEVSRIREHPGFQKDTFMNDISVLRLKRPVTFNEYIRPVCLPERGDESYFGKTAIATGWGTQTFGGPYSEVLREVKLVIWNNTECDNRFIQPITEVFLCAGPKRREGDSCQGDSGGPLMVQSRSKQWTLVGVISWGIKCGEPGVPGIYTRIPHFLDYIYEHAVNQ